MIKQSRLFGVEEEVDAKYTSIVDAPVYTPSRDKPHLLELCNASKVHRLIDRIKTSNVTEDEKAFLIQAAQRHLVFNYELIADYYAHSNKEMQALMEESALVIIDFEQAIERGFVTLCNDIRQQYLQEYA